MNGCGIYDFARGEYRKYWLMELDRMLPYLRRGLELFPDMELQAYTENGICYCTPRETAHPQLLAMHVPCSFATLDDLEGKKMLKCFLYAPEEREEALMSFLHSGEAAGLFRHVPGTTDVGGPITYHELLPIGASKGSCVRWLRDQPGLRGRAVFAAGDFWNDYELLREADIPVAPANAIDEIKAICRYVTVSNNEHVIKHIVEDILPVAEL